MVAARAGDVARTGAIDPLSLFGLFAISFMLLCYVLEDRSPWWILAFAFGCLLSSAYGFMQGAWPFGAVELIWTAVSLHRWRRAIRKAEPLA